MNFKSFKSVIAGGGKMQFPEHRDIVRNLGADSMVLLKNSGVLPINKGKIALFGAGAVDTLFCGLLFNYVYGSDWVNVRQGLENNGFTFSTESWLNKMEKACNQKEKEDKSTAKSGKAFVGHKGDVDAPPISQADLAESVLGTDTCIYVVRHGISLGATNQTCDEYLLTEREQSEIELLAANFENLILVLNCQMLEIGAVAKMKNVKGIILMGLPGMEAGNSLADIITGAVNPSGRLGSTWAKKYKDYSTCFSAAAINKTLLKNEIDYREGIYVGYRYFDSFDVAPLYPFGYGLSYTTFKMELEYIEASWMFIILRIKVTNTGSCAGRQVVQAYVSQPEGNITKPYQQLFGFAKTGKLKPGEYEEITIKMQPMALCSFDDDAPAWILEKGDYLIRIGDNSRDTKLCGKVVLDKTTVIKQVVNVMNHDKEMEYLTPPPRPAEETGYIMVASLSADDYNSENKAVNIAEDVNTYVPEGSTYVSYVNDNSYKVQNHGTERVNYVPPCGYRTFIDVIKGKVSMEDFISSLSPEILARIVAGTVNESKLESENRFNFTFNIDRRKLDISARTTAQFETTLGIPGVAIADGPSGLRIEGISCTCFPSPENMARTWDMGAMIRMGRALGREMEFYEIDYLLAPPLNIQRNPMRDRAYEFYSEDPLLSGTMGAGLVMGVHRYEGRDVILKNLPTYNQESGTTDININMSRQTFSELYLRPFSCCVCISNPAGLLASGNRINGQYVSAQKELNTYVLRDDLGFKGFILSDWGAVTEKPYDLIAGCDLIMPGYDPDKILEAMMVTQPTFEPDGYVAQVEKCMVFGEPMISYEKWGSFKLDKAGEDTCQTTVEPNVALNEKIERLEKNGLCTVSVAADGTRTITYKGINRGAYMALGDLQHAVMHILNTTKNSASMKRILDTANI